MHISDINIPIPIEAIHSDRIEASLSYPPPPFITMQVYLHRLKSFLRMRGIRIIAWKRKEVELIIEFNGHSIPVAFRFRCRGRNKPLYVYFSFNPIVPHNQLTDAENRFADTPERPFIAVHNWLRANDPITPLGISHVADEFIITVDEVITALVDDFYQLGSSLTINHSEIHIQKIELCADIRCTGVGNTVHLFNEVFPSVFKKTKRRAFRSSEQVYGADEVTQFVEGYHRNGIRAKLYEKTNHRIRAEISFTKRALRYRSIDTQIKGDNFFADIFPQIADIAHPLFQLFLTPLATSNDNVLSVSDIEAFAAIISRTGPRNAISTINRIVNMHRITTASMPRARRQQLLDAGILERVDRGVLRLVPRYRQALERIQSTLSNDEVA